MGGPFMFEDERRVPPGHHYNIGSVVVPGKTMWQHCARAGDYREGVWGDHTLAAHMRGVNFGFIDGHAKTEDFTPFEDWWFATGGRSRLPGTPSDYGERAYTYPPVLNQISTLPGAQWWSIPWYPVGPVFNR